MSAVVEGDVDEAVVRKLIVEAGGQPGSFYGKAGKSALRNRRSTFRSPRFRGTRRGRSRSGTGIHRRFTCGGRGDRHDGRGLAQGAAEVHRGLCRLPTLGQRRKPHVPRREPCAAVRGAQLRSFDRYFRTLGSTSLFGSSEGRGRLATREWVPRLTSPAVSLPPPQPVEAPAVER